MVIFVFMVQYLKRVNKTYAIMKRALSTINVFLVLVILSFPLNLRGQEEQAMVKYTPDFRFRDGIYLNFDQVRLNDPVPKAKILTSADYNDKEFFKDLFENDKIYFYDSMGLRQEVDKNNIWGYARNGILYIQLQGNFSRITFVGSISHFVADIISYDSRYNSPYGYYDPYYSPFYSPYYYPYSYGSYYPYGYSPYRQNTARSEIKQYLIDFESGKMMEFDLESTELFLMRDGELYEEFVQLPRKKKKEMMFVFIRRFNEKNPLYIPENK